MKTTPMKSWLEGGTFITNFPEHMRVVYEAAVASHGDPDLFVSAIPAAPMVHGEGGSLHSWRSHHDISGFWHEFDKIKAAHERRRDCRGMIPCGKCKRCLKLSGIASVDAAARVQEAFATGKLPDPADEALLYSEPCRAKFDDVGRLTRDIDRSLNATGSEPQRTLKQLAVQLEGAALSVGPVIPAALAASRLFWALENYPRRNPQQLQAAKVCEGVRKLAACAPAAPDATSKFRIGQWYTTRADKPHRIPVRYKLEWIDVSLRSFGVALWRNQDGYLHLQNMSDFDVSSGALR